MNMLPFLMKFIACSCFFWAITVMGRAESTETLVTLPNLWKTGNGVMQTVQMEGENVLRWKPEAGKSATLEMKTDHPLFSRLRYYDRLEFEFRIVQGQFDELEFRIMGHVTGPRKYKVHQWRLGISTTAPGIWHARQLDLSRPSWFPWDHLFPDGVDPQFQFGALAMVPDTIIEIRRLHLSATPLIIKPIFEYPITWPVRSLQPDGSSVYTMSVPVLNTSGHALTIQAALASSHKRFKVGIEPAAIDVKNGDTATFVITSSINKADIEAVPELYSELAHVAFCSSEDPQNISTFEMPLTRPLSPGVHRQFALSADDFKWLRAQFASGDAEVRKALKTDQVLSDADKFLAIRLDHIPTGNMEGPARPPSNPAARLEVGSFMPEVVNPA